MSARRRPVRWLLGRRREEWGKERVFKLLDLPGYRKLQWYACGHEGRICVPSRSLRA